MDQKASRTRSLKSIIAVTFVKVLGAILSFVTVAGIAGLFGATAVTDAYLLARRISSNIAVALERYFMLINVPNLVDLFEKQGLKALEVTIRTAQRRILLIAIIASAFLILISDMFIHTVVPGFGEDQHSQAVFYFRILVLALPISAVTAYSGASMNALKLFSLPALFRLLPRFFVVIALGLVWIWQFSIVNLTVAVLVGTLMMGAVFLLKTKSIFNAEHKPTASRKSTPRIKFKGQRMWAMFIAQLHVIGAGWIDLFFISLTGEGSVASWDIGQRLVNFVPGAMTGSVMLVYYTSLAEANSNQDREGFINHSSDAMRLTLLAVLPVSALLLTLAQPLIEVLLHHGAFDVEGVNRTSLTVQALALVLPINAVLGVLTSILFVRNDVSHIKIILITLAISLAVRIGIDITLVPSLGFAAVPLGTIAAMSSLLLALLFLLYRHFGALITAVEVRTIAFLLFSFAIATGAMWIVASYVDWQSLSRLLASATITGVGAMGVVIYGAMVFSYRIPETKDFGRALAKIRRQITLK